MRRFIYSHKSVMRQDTERVKGYIFFLFFIYCQVYHEDEWYKTVWFDKINLFYHLTSCLSSTAVFIFFSALNLMSGTV